MRTLLRTARTLALALSIGSALAANVALASSISLVVTNPGTGTQVGNDVTFGPGGGSVIYDIFLDATESFAGVVVSASFPGASGTGTAAPFIDDGAIFIPQVVGTGPFPGDDAMGQWAFVSPSLAVSPGSYLLGTMTVTTGVSTDVMLGVLTIDDDFIDANFFSAPLTTGSATISVIPEPGTACLLGVGLAGLVLRRRRFAGPLPQA